MNLLIVVVPIIILVGGGLLAISTVPQTPVGSTLPIYGEAPEIAGIAGWINTQPLTLESLRGKVVLVDFWTYSCINCIRTLPYIKAWDEKYRDKGLVILSIHTPEFAFEKEYANVKSFVEQNDIHYAVALDNDYQTWRAFQNSYWPRKYLIDRDGKIRYDHIGEGAYDETEAAIQELLGTQMSSTGQVAEGPGAVGTPELYLGYNFIRAPIGNSEGLQPGQTVEYADTEVREANTVYLSGSWTSLSDAVESVDGSMLLVYFAKNVNIVAGGKGTVDVWVDGAPASGKDAPQGVAAIDEERLYNVVSLDSSAQHVLRLDVSPGVRIYTFTFG